MNETVTLKDLQTQLRGYKYNYLYRALVALEQRAIIHPWRGNQNEYQLTLDDARRLRRFLQIVKNGKSFKTAVLELKIEEQETEIERLRSLVPVSVTEPWWKRVLSWFAKLTLRRKLSHN